MLKLQKTALQKVNQNKMKKLFVFLIVVSLLPACDNIEKLDKQMYEGEEDTIAVTSLEQLDEIDKQEELSDKTNPSQLLVKASGSEPGWFAEIYNNRLRLVVDYGKDSLLLLDNSFEKARDKEGFLYLNASLSNGLNKTVKIKIDVSECTDASGEKRSRKISVTYNKKTYTGCAELVN